MDNITVTMKLLGMGIKGEDGKSHFMMRKVEEGLNKGVVLRVHTQASLGWDPRDKWGEVVNQDQDLGPNRVQEQDLVFHPSRGSLREVGDMVLNNKAPDQWLLVVSREFDLRCSSSRGKAMEEVVLLVHNKVYVQEFLQIKVLVLEGEAMYLALVEGVLSNNNLEWDLNNNCQQEEVCLLELIM